MEDIDKQLEGMKQDVTGLQVWNPDSTSYFQADGTDPYSYGNGEGLDKLQKLFDFVGKNQENITAVGGLVSSVGANRSGGECKGLFGGKLKRALGRCQDNVVTDLPMTNATPTKSNTGLYIGIGVGVLILGTVAFLLMRKK
jgi:hypothetical protein